MAWVQAHRKALLAAKKGAAGSVNGNLNVPTCVTGRIRGPVNVTVATSFTGYSIGTVDCSSTADEAKDRRAGLRGRVRRYSRNSSRSTHPSKRPA